MEQKVNFSESETIKNLSKSYAVECMDGAKYQFLAKLAVKEGLSYLETVFKTLAKHEMSHAKVFWDLLHENAEGKIIENIDFELGYPFDCNDLVEGTKCHIKNEKELSDIIYPNYALVAREEGFLDVEKKFKLIATVENCHRALLEQIHQKLVSKQLYKSATEEKWKCSQCGFEHTAKEPPAPCPLCGYEKGAFEIKFDMGD